MQLKPYQEIVGNLTDVITNDEITKAIFSMMLEIEIPNEKIDNVKLRKYIGDKIGILNNEGKIMIRKITIKNP